MEIHIRDLIREIDVPDLQAVHDIDSGTFGSDKYPLSFFRQAYELYRETFFIFVPADKVVGYCLGTLKPINRRVGWILSIAVLDSHRGRGYGSALLSKTLESMNNYGCKEIFLSVSPDNIIAKKLFNKYEFVTVKRDEEYFGLGHPREIMRLLLP